jgi:hypothetical protein
MRLLKLEDVSMIAPPTEPEVGPIVVANQAVAGARGLAYGARVRRSSMLLGCLLVPTLVALTGLEASAAEPAPEPAPAAEGDATVEAAYIKVTLTHAGKTYAHPGFRVGKAEQGVFVIECEGKNHEIAVTLREGDSERLSVNVEYSVDGRQVLAQDLSVAAGKDTSLGKGTTKLAINVDPQGKKDTSRKDEDKLDEPEGDDPL